MNTRARDTKVSRRITETTGRWRVATAIGRFHTARWALATNGPPAARQRHVPGGLADHNQKKAID